MDSDNDSYHSESEFYYPDEENMSNARVRCGPPNATKASRGKHATTK